MLLSCVGGLLPVCKEKSIFHLVPSLRGAAAPAVMVWSRHRGFGGVQASNVASWLCPVTCGDGVHEASAKVCQVIAGQWS
jgi:hypothetical protein